MKEQKQPKAVLRRKWDFRTGSPQRVFRAIQDVIEDLGYSIMVSKPPLLQESPITDTATFGEAEVGGEKQITARYNWQQGVRGIALLIAAIVMGPWGIGIIIDGEVSGLILVFIGFVLAVIGIAFLATASEARKQLVKATMEGEAYKSSATVVERAQETDIVADVHVVVTVNIASFGGGTKFEDKVRDTDRRIMVEDFAELERRLETVLQSFRLR